MLRLTLNIVSQHGIKLGNWQEVTNLFLNSHNQIVSYGCFIIANFEV